MSHIEWQKQSLVLLDQRKLPHCKEYVCCETYLDVASAISDMVVRGAPAIGAVAAYGMAMAAVRYNRLDGGSTADLLRHLERAAKHLQNARPTAVNLAWAVGKMLDKAREGATATTQDIEDMLCKEAERIAAEDKQINRSIGKNGASLLPSDARVLTYCNAGALATVDYGTALGIIRWAHESGKIQQVYACETRPYLQGARLTAYEMAEEGINCTLITDNTAGYIMYNKMLDAVIVGADRITRSGHVANKIGTYSLAVLAHTHRIPFYVAAPLSTFDLTIDSPTDIPIEERAAAEVTHFGGIRIASEGIQVFNPSFDITPPSLITALITEKGIIMHPDSEKITQLCREESDSCF